MKRYYDLFIVFAIDTIDTTFELTFSTDWRSSDMLRFMCDTYAIDEDSIVETRTTFVKRYKITKDD